MANNRWQPCWEYNTCLLLILPAPCFLITQRTPPLLCAAMFPAFDPNRSYRFQAAAAAAERGRRRIASAYNVEFATVCSLLRELLKSIYNTGRTQTGSWSTIMSTFACLLPGVCPNNYVSVLHQK